MNPTHPTPRVFPTTLRRLAPLALAFLCVAPLRGEEVALETPIPASRFALRLGAFLVSDIDAEVSLTTSSGAGGTVIDFGDTLGGETSANVFRVDADWYISGPHRLQGAWYDLDLKGHREIDRDIHFGDEVFPAHAEIDSRLRTNIYKISYGYTFNEGKKHEITGLIGAHVMSLTTSIAAPNLGRREGYDITAPLPAFGIGWTAHWTSRFKTRVVAQYFGLSVDDDTYKGHFFDFLASAEYRLSRHWAVGGGYNRFDLEIDTRRDSRTLHLTDKYNGFLAYVGLYF